MLTFTKHSDQQFTLLVSKGNTTIDEWLDTLKQYGTEGITKFELFDLRHHSNLFTSQEIEQIISFVRENAKYRPPETKTAILVTEISMYGVSRMYEILNELVGTDGIVTEVFYDLDKAVEWLGIQIKDDMSNGSC